MTVDSEGTGAAADTSDVWSEWLAGLPDGARLLDLATGSGQVARYATTAARGAAKSFRIVGVDYAEIPDDPDLTAAGVVMAGGVSVERLPFADASFDAAVSQYGIEYADPGSALAELARVLAPGGVAQMLIHHAESEITRQGRLRIEAYDAVMADGAAIHAGRQAFLSRLTSPSGQAADETARAFRQSVLELARRTAPTPAFATVRYLVIYLNDLAMGVDRYGPASALQHLDAFERGNAAWRERQACQVAAALDATAMQAFVAEAERAGLASTTLATRRDEIGGLIGWLARFQRRETPV